ncbi:MULTISPECIES: cytochrome c oxidase subunit 4 [unclassified Aeromicrobium]|jgi:Cytochrome c oxidase subunit IV|uniref:cytochrome c oxidase subunit 4 n=1 Tax=unclassified Aeromicrobium TaxID=2633570 RepID=UPI0027E3ADBF|nr:MULTISPECIES: cytochrome c oxidase subunit 4 [unclassified Aeromicrobium]MDR6119145.1 putative membrane protein YdjX (TVP38/TMEM64 family) [Aeromicrobium sp. SORGH_AS_0981]
MKGMKAEYWVIISCGIFFVFIAPVYWVLTEDPTGTTALVMTFLLCALLGFYLYVVAKQIPARPEDLDDAEIADGAGELGFFPPYSWWPLYCALALGTIVLGVVVGWWLFIIGATIGAVTVCGWVYEYYRGVHAH